MNYDIVHVKPGEYLHISLLVWTFKRGGGGAEHHIIYIIRAKYFVHLSNLQILTWLRRHSNSTHHRLKYLINSQSTIK